MEDITGVSKKIFDSIGENILLVDKDYKIIFVNDSMLNLFGRDGKDVIGRKCHEFFHNSQVPCHKNEACPVECPHEAIFTTGETVILTHPHIMPDGIERIFEITASPFMDKKGDIIQMIEILRDVTDKKKAEETIRKQELFLKSILDSIGEGVIVVGRDYKIISANSGFLKQTKRSLNDVIGKHCYEVTHHIDKPCSSATKHECSVKYAFEEESSKRVIHEHFDIDNNIIHVETVAYPLISPDGEVRSVVEIITDVTERMRLDKEVRKKVKELEEFYDMAIGREMKMVELKKEVKRLKQDAEKDEGRE